MRLRVGTTAWSAVLSLALLVAVPGSQPAHAATGWTATADSGAAAKAVDSDPSTFWQTGATAFPHRLTVDTAAVGPLTGVVLTPRQDGSPTGNIGRFRVEVSVNGSYWRTVVAGVLADTSAAKTVQLAPVNARYVRLVVLSEAGDRSTRTSLAELTVLRTAPRLRRPGPDAGRCR